MQTIHIPRRFLLLAGTALFTATTALAQQVRVSGQVLDQDQQPVIGATVRVVGSKDEATVTDLDGRYSLQADKNARLEISYIGFKTEQVKAGQNTRVTLKEEMNTLGEVVAIGYGSVRRADVTTAVSSISADDLDTRPIVSAASGMQGKAAGLQISQANGAPGSAPTIRVRGTTSLNGSNNPLYVVDGVPVSDIDFLSADDIDNMQVLKDASSAAIYGSRAANGVIIINTKKGKAGVARVSLNAHYTFNGVRDNQDPLNTQQYYDLIQDMNYQGVLNLKLPEGLTDQTDWKKEVYRTGHVQDYQLSVTNGTDKLRYYLSGGYTGEDGVIVSSNFKRYNVRGSIDNDINKWLTINADGAYSDYTYKGTNIISGTTASRGGVIPSILATPTYAPVWDPEKPGQYYNNFYGANADSPIENIARSKDGKRQYNKLLLTGKAIITLMPELKFTSSLTFDRSNSLETYFLDPSSTRQGRNDNGNDNRSTARPAPYGPSITPPTGSISSAATTSTSWSDRRGPTANTATTTSPPATMPMPTSRRSTPPTRSVGRARAAALRSGASCLTSAVCSTTTTPPTWSPPTCVLMAARVWPRATSGAGSPRSQAHGV